MQESINPTHGPTASSNTGTALLAGAALIGGAALLAQPKAAHALSPAVTYAQIPGAGDFKPLNFALALEIIEADLYVQAIKRMTTGGTNDLGQTITGLNTPESDLFVKYLREFGKVEQEHRDFLLKALGSNAISNSLLKGAKFDFGINTFDASTLLDLLINVEATGVMAYIGAVPQFAVRSKYLPTAAAIQGTEARHTAALIVVKNRLRGTTDPTAPQANDNGGRDKAANLDEVLAGVSKYIVLGK